MEILPGVHRLQFLHRDRWLYVYLLVGDRAHIEDHDRLWQERYTGSLTPHGLVFSPDLAEKMRTSMGRAVSVDMVLTGGERIRLRSDWEIQVLFTPGHTRGHVSVYDPRFRAAFIADAALGLGLPAADGSRLALPPNYDDVDSYAATARALRGFALDLLCTSHYPLLRGEEVPRFLAETEEWIDRTDQAILAALQEARSPLRMRDLIAAVNPRLGNWPEGPAITLAVALTAHLDRGKT